VSNQLKLLVSGRNKTALELLRESCSLPGFTVDVKHINNGHADPLHGVDTFPDLLVFHMGESDKAELECLVERPADGRPATIVIGPQGNTNFMRLAMQAGARDYLEDPVAPLELRQALGRIQQELRHRPDAREGKLIAVVSAKGGAGASFIAVNLAHIMAAQSGLAATLLDLDLQFGSLAQYLDLHPKTGLMRALDMAENLDAVAADACMAKHKSGLALLSPLEEEVVLSRDISPDRFTRLLSLLKQNYDRTVVDLPRQIDELSAVVYEQADRVLLVMQQELACLRDATRLRRLLTCELAVPAERITAVVNRYEKSMPVELNDICQRLNVTRSELVLVPNHYRSVAESINVGVPMLDHARSSTVTKALLALEAKLGGETADKEPSGIFSRTLQLMRG
jgi:pilus assembly protein CpaE